MPRTRRITIAAVASALGLLASPVPARAERGCRWCEDRRPYGDYCRGRRGGSYGANDPVKTVEEARARLERFYEDEDVVVGRITEKTAYFEADIRDRDGGLLDRVIIDKRTGRIRSMY